LEPNNHVNPLYLMIYRHESRYTYSITRSHLMYFCTTLALPFCVNPPDVRDMVNQQWHGTNIFMQVIQVDVGE